MSALVYYAYSTIYTLYDLTAALYRTGFNWKRSIRHLKTKQRQQLFRRHCCEVWRQYYQKNRLSLYATKQAQVAAALSHQNSITEKEEIDHLENIPSKRYWQLVTHRNWCQNNNNTLTLNTLTLAAKMQRKDFDFTGIEASADAFEVLENFMDTERAGFQHAELQRFGETDEIEVINGDEVDTTFYEYNDKLPVYYNDQIGQLKEGISFTFTGYILWNCERFSINFILGNSHKDVALHLNPRLPQNYIVRNTKAKNIWGREEVASALPFVLRRGSKFSIQVLVTEACYMISVNGQHFTCYNHRLPYSEVAAVEVKGDVEKVDLDFGDVLQYPALLPENETQSVRLALTTSTSNETLKNDKNSAAGDYDEVDAVGIPAEWRLIPMSKQKSELNHTGDAEFDNSEYEKSTGLKLPYIGTLPLNSLKPGRCLKIIGRVKLLPHSFYVNFQKGYHIWPHPVVAFHFNPRFSKQGGAIGKAIVCRNAWYNGAWAEEERSELDIDFRPGKTFCMTIVCGNDQFEVYVNRKLTTEFNYHINPDVVDTIYIQGDIKLWDVVLENHSKVNENKRIYTNPTYTEE